jgi:hemerythrin-like domain-containing protein
MKSNRKTAAAKKTGRKKMAGKSGMKNMKSVDKTKKSEDAAIALLMQDHKMVQDIFKEYRKLMKNGADDREKQELVQQACDMLTVHTQIEEEIFYPAVRRGMDDQEIMDEALVEHDGAKDLIAQLQNMRPGDQLYDAKFIVLGEQVKHHIEEEESKIFPKAKKADIDLQSLGDEMMDMKEELEEEIYSGGRPMQRRGGRTGYYDQQQQYQGYR